MATSALETVGDYIAEARVLLQDLFTPYRYTDAELVSALNTALLEVRRLRSDLLLPSFDIPFYPATPTTTKVLFEPMYRNALVYYIVGRAQLRDDEATTDARAAALITKFTAQMLSISS